MPPRPLRRLTINPRLLPTLKSSGRRLGSLAIVSGFSSLSRLSATLHDGQVIDSAQNVAQMRALAASVDFQEPI
jgi:hypothetical protein